MQRRLLAVWTLVPLMSVVLLAAACAPASNGNTPAEPPGAAPTTQESGTASSRPASDVSVKVSRPATLADAVRAIDPRTLEMLNHGEVFHKNAAKVGYQLSKPNLKSDVQFYKDKLTQAGWKVESEDVDEAKSFGCLKYSKDGFCVAVDIVKNPNDGKMMAFVENYGNLDARTLPRYAGAKETQAGFNVVIHEAKAKADDVAAFVRAEFKKLGWRATNPYGTGSGSVAGEYYFLGFIQNAINVNVHITAEEGASEVMYHTSLLKYAAPIHPNVTGSIDMSEDPNLRMFYSTKATAKDVLDFYRRESPVMGWVMKPGPSEADDGQITVALEGPQKEPLRLEVLEKGGHTLVQIAPAGATPRTTP